MTPSACRAVGEVLASPPVTTRRNPRAFMLVSSYGTDGPFGTIEEAQGVARHLAVRGVADGRDDERPRVTEGADSLPLESFGELLDAATVQQQVDSKFLHPMTDGDRAQRAAVLEVDRIVTEACAQLHDWERVGRRNGAWWMRLTDPVARHLYEQTMRRLAVEALERTPGMGNLAAEIRHQFWPSKPAP